MLTTFTIRSSKKFSIQSNTLNMKRSSKKTTARKYHTHFISLDDGKKKHVPYKVFAERLKQLEDEADPTKDDIFDDYMDELKAYEYVRTEDIPIEEGEGDEGEVVEKGARSSIGVRGKIKGALGTEYIPSEFEEDEEMTDGEEEDEVDTRTEEEKERERMEREARAYTEEEYQKFMEYSKKVSTPIVTHRAKKAAYELHKKEPDYWTPIRLSNLFKMDSHFMKVLLWDMKLEEEAVAAGEDLDFRLQDAMVIFKNLS
eukprot:TRINITY_DN512_c0_g1_i2.p1 TRINITY_DN512_c0_g1~~TRINITY_DN512_c0_g1_i2.p1  ORF type:complete len:257 (+),score=88.29 TRINITY_DN512_c0_g1_i2:33-803(+)